MPRADTNPDTLTAARATRLAAISVRGLVLRVVLLGPAVVLALTLVACGGHGGSGDASTGDASTGAVDATATDTSGPEAAGTPQVEDTGPESPRPPNGDNRPAIDMASLPVGGGPDDSSAQHECIGVSWLGSDIPDGFSIVVTSVRIKPRDAFAVSSSGCDGPRCASSFAFTHKGDTCFVPVDATGSPNEDARLYVDGRLRYPAGQRRSGEAFAAHEEKRSIGLTVPDQPEPTTQPPVTPEPGTVPTQADTSASPG